MSSCVFSHLWNGLNAEERIRSYICVHTVQYSVSRHFFTLMASLARPFLWKPGSHGNAACLFELEMSFSIPHSSPCVFTSLFASQFSSSVISLSLTGQLLSVKKSCTVQGDVHHKWRKWKEEGSASVPSKKKIGEGGHLFWKVRGLGF